jgi:hypothetical protein
VFTITCHYFSFSHQYLQNGLPVFSDPWVVEELIYALTEKMIGLELCMKYPGEDLSEIDREYNVLSERLRAVECLSGNKSAASSFYIFYGT